MARQHAMKPAAEYISQTARCVTVCFPMCCRTWKRDKSGDDVPANLYSVRFFNQGKNGFILGNDGILLRYIGA
jgi:photosystem II stability/assembly factor-like uncharacterized protein